MEIQHDLLPETNDPLIGTTVEVLCEGTGDDGVYVGRAYFQAPEVDGKIIFTCDRPVHEGEFIPVAIESYREYDFYGTASFPQE